MQNETQTTVKRKDKRTNPDPKGHSTPIWKRAAYGLRSCFTGTIHFAVFGLAATRGERSAQVTWAVTRSTA